nr:uncharacterized protein LOC129279583 [Lytechinus pictus]
MGHIMTPVGEQATPSYISLLKRASFRRQPAYVKVAAKIEEEIRIRDIQAKSLLTRANQLKNHYSDEIHYVTKTIEWKMGGKLCYSYSNVTSLGLMAKSCDH